MIHMVTTDDTKDDIKIFDSSDDNMISFQSFAKL